ncbi:MAG: BON domain-containing protein [Pirellulales bacterium]
MIDPELRERTLILRGTVASEDDRALAERLARLEPGVSHVENRLRVADGRSDRAPP